MLDGRGCQIDSGSFTITELATDPVSGKITNLNATFQQRCKFWGSNPRAAC